MFTQMGKYDGHINLAFGLILLICGFLCSCEEDSKTTQASAIPNQESRDSLFVYIGQARVYFRIDTTSLLIKWNSEPSHDGSSNNPDDYPNIGEPYSDNFFQGFAWYRLTGEYSYDSLLNAFRELDAIKHANEVLFMEGMEMQQMVRT